MTAADAGSKGLVEAITYLETQLRAVREDQAKSQQTIEELRRQVHELHEIADEQKRSVREVDARFNPFRGLPEKLRALDEGAEQIRQELASSRAEIDNSIRILTSEGEYDRQERSHAIKRIESADSQLGLIAADVGQIQAQVSNVAQAMQTLIERQREVEDKVEQAGLRLERAIEVNRDLEQRLRDALTDDQESRFAVINERLQVVGEMVRRNEELIEENTADQILRREVLDEVSILRDQVGRAEARLASLDEAGERLALHLDRVQAEVTLVEGRHSGLSERVAASRRDIAEIIDQVRDEFANFNKLIEKQRRKQIQVLEQELRELKFHAFRPPEEP